ncbi:acetylornithine transaminase [Cumulibacter manganitolerans]|uniref:acetylornithine transaminase n=1 Tax=Cumulibacter manganitolerans TaxID=1884992 RepID=UPI0012960BE8|nr:acetylornithine transaminase [Cumulibacter manganitolerans]
MTSSDYTARWTASLMNNYGTPPVTLVRGDGPFVYDVDGKRYLDLLAGIAVNILGHAHPRIVEAVSTQIATLGHVSNLYAHPRTIELAERLLTLAGRAGKVLFCNSGAEANEAAFKLSRLTGRTKVVAAEGAFHGRTMGALSLTGQPAKADPFRPLPGDVVHVPYGDIDAMRAAVDDQTAMVLLEPIMGEGGVIVPPEGYLPAVQDLAREHGALFALDEVQTGICRTGDWFAFQHEGLQPDVITLAKGLGGGLPIGACLAFGDAGDLLTPGMHGTTFGGNPVAAAAGLAVLDVATESDLNGAAKSRGAHVADALADVVGDVRGRGLLRAFDVPADSSKDLADRLRGKGFLVNNVSPSSIRLAPPLIITDDQLDTFVDALAAELEETS